ncbi:MAG: mycothiol synthase [Propionibacteriaceae bacterium]
MSVDLHVKPSLDDVEAAQVDAVVDRVEIVDGVSPLNDDARLALRHHRPATLHLLARVDHRLVGYAQLERCDDAPTVVLGVDPDHRRQGVGTALVAAARAATPRPVGFWAFHDLAPARALAQRSGLVGVRELLLMGTKLDADVTTPAEIPGISIRPFVVGADEQSWLTVNARAFADHPEQGRTTLAELQERMAEDWFAADDFLLAVRTGHQRSADDGAEVVGFHWTKRHSPTRGEVYVLGVDPTVESRGLGTALLLSGLHHLHDVGVTEVILYVEAEHERAVRLYAGRGFAVWARDVMYAPPSGSPPSPGDAEEK